MFAFSLTKEDGVWTEKDEVDIDSSIQVSTDSVIAFDDPTLCLNFSSKFNPLALDQNDFTVDFISESNSEGCNISFIDSNMTTSANSVCFEFTFENIWCSYSTEHSISISFNPDRTQFTPNPFEIPI